MAVGPDQAARRQEGVMPLPASALEGSVGKDVHGSAVGGGGAKLPTTEIDVTMHAPDAGRVNRDTGSANTNMGSASEPFYDTTPAGAFDTNQRSAPFNSPDSSGIIATDPSHSDWDDQNGTRIDGFARNSRPIAFNELSTFDMVGEEPQGENGAGELLEGEK